MSKKLSVALLEDSLILLNDLQAAIEENDLGQVLFVAQRSDDFLEKMKSYAPDALILDIDLNGDSMTGVDVANRFKDKPVFFITGKTKDYIDQIEELRINKDVPVEFLTKPINDEKLKNLFAKFEKSIKAFEKVSKLNLKVLHQRNGLVEQKNIMFIKAKENSESNNKLIQLFDDPNPLEMSHSSLNKFFELGLSEEMFIQTSQSCLVNKEVLKKLEITRDKSVYLFTHKFPGIEKTLKIEITEKYWSNPKRK